ncbi:tyrosine-type recombinase/integrase [Kitasatospora kifunensis]|uniref:Integrase n=1 Tax=Kitasatospora kifunensis TaxID=58351 RepID=A0A7W7W0E4_KITKI|nr:tyrosine-type recombinase/integrase [Kitasatospora kifunensis]MBB4929083.1 integrase [Kitasatospora kifunensis]
MTTTQLDPRPDGAIPALPSSSLAETVFKQLIEDLGLVQTGRIGQQRLYTPRAELLARVVTPQTWVTVLDWISSTRRSSVGTKREYVDDIRRWAAFAAEIGHERFFVGCLTADDIRSWRIREQAKVSTTGKKRSPRTIIRKLRSLSSLHNYAKAKDPTLPPNPVTEDDLPHIPRGHGSHSTPVIEKEDVQALVLQADDLLDEVVVELLYVFAGRVDELCACDLDHQVNRGRRALLDLTRKGDEDKMLPVPLDQAEKLDRLNAGRTDGPLLLARDGGRLDPSDVDRILTRLGHRARILTCPGAGQPGHNFKSCRRCRDVTPHVLRASRITHMLDDKEPLEEVQAFANHKDPATTIGYRERRQAGKRDAALADKGAALFAGLRPVEQPARSANADTAVEGTDLVEVRSLDQNSGQLAVPLP